MRRTSLLAALLAVSGALLMPVPTMAVELEVAELVAAIKRAIVDAQKSAKPPTMNIPWIEAEISYVVRQEGSGGLKMYVVTVEGTYATEAVQRVKYRLEPTRPLRVERSGEIYGPIAGVDRAAGKVFIGEARYGVQGGWSPAFPFLIKRDTKILDRFGGTKTIGDLKPGTSAKIVYEPSNSGDLAAQSIVIYP